MNVQEKKRQERLAAKQTKDAEKSSKQPMKLMLRDVGPPDDLDIEMTALKRQALQARRSAPAGDEAAAAAAAAGASQDAEEPLELQIERPQFPPEDIMRRLVPAFNGALPAFARASRTATATVAVSVAYVCWNPPRAMCVRMRMILHY